MSEPRYAALRALQQLRAVTAEPPAATAEPDEVLTRGHQVLAAREEPLRDLFAALERDPGALRGVDEAAELYACVQQRAAAWHAALARAKHVVGERLQSAARLRQARR
jgi:hypothetical protein